MPKNVYEEALADVKDLMAVAERNARDKVLEAVTPHIKSLIESTLLAEDTDDESDEGDDSLLLDDGESTPDPIETQSDAISMPDEDGKITLDLDALDVGGDDEVELDTESFNVLRASYKTNLQTGVSRLVKSVNEQCSSPSCDIASLLTKVDDMYEHVHTAQLDADTKRECELRLGECLSRLIDTERKNMKIRKTIREDDETKATVEEKPGELTLKLSGLPADVDLENVGVDLIADDQGAPEDGEADAETGSDEDELDLGDLDLSDEGDDEEETEQKVESASCSEDEVIEIDEGALRAEVARLRRSRKIRESEGVDRAVMDDFGGGDPEEEAFLDGEVTTAGDDTVLEIDDVELQTEMRRHRAPLARRLAQRRNLRNESRHVQRANRSRLSEGTRRRAESGNAENERLRKQLLAQNLDNVKLACANKLLQVEGLNHRQKSAVIRRLDEAKTVSEAKAVYGSVVRAAKSQSLNESARVRPAGGSAVTKPTSSSVLNESADGGGFSLDRWAVLSGITPRR